MVILSDTREQTHEGKERPKTRTVAA